jgi:NADH:quinone reductase (non-electrogenic)
VLLKRIENEAIQTLKAKQSLIVDEGEVPVSETGTVGKNFNNPAAEVYNIGKSKL